MTTILMDATVYPPRNEPQWIKRSVAIVADSEEEAREAAWDWIADIEISCRSCVVTTLPTIRWHPLEGLRPWDIFTEMLITMKGHPNV